MRLLNVNSLKFTIFSGRHRPPYVAASHRWLNDGETTFQDVRYRRNVSSKGYQKVEAFAKYIREHLSPIEWLWIDTCCINQDSTAELSEAINLMFEWYQHATLCLAYLVDVDVDAGEGPGSFEQSEWFRRGWTLQELLAPRTVVFVAKTWEVLGYKGDSPSDRWPCFESNLGARIARITRIPEHVLQDYETSSSPEISIEEKLSWMDGRSTTRLEDMWYALYGIFGVSPGVNYGEKFNGARQRLAAAVQQKAMLVSKQAYELQKVAQRLSSSGPRTELVSASQTVEVPQAIEGDVLARIAWMRELSKALHTASLTGREKEVRMMLEAGADVNPDSTNRLNPLQAASFNGHERVVQILLDKKADVNVRGETYCRALFAATLEGHSNVVQMLIAAGADVNAEADYNPERGRNSSHDEMLHRTHALEQASKQGRAKIVQMLLDAGADVNGQASGHDSALVLACNGGHEKVVRMLIDAGAYINAQGRSHGNAIQVASARPRRSSKEILRMLIDAGADVNALGRGTYRSALSAAIENRNTAVEQMLRNAGAI